MGILSKQGKDRQVEHSPHKLKDTSVDPHTHIKVRHGSAYLQFQEGGGGDRDRRVPETHWPAILAEPESCRFSERQCQKIRWRGIGEDA